MLCWLSPPMPRTVRFGEAAPNEPERRTNEPAWSTRTIRSSSLNDRSALIRVVVFAPLIRIDAAPPAPAGQMGAGPIGQVRSTGVAFLLFIVTFGIYGWYYWYKVHEEMKQHSGQGIGGAVARAERAAPWARARDWASSPPAAAARYEPPRGADASSSTGNPG